MDEEMEERAKHYAHADSDEPEYRVERERAEDDTEVVEDRREREKNEAAMHLRNACQNSGESEKNRLEQEKQTSGNLKCHVSK
jgi:hypothetical protein